MSIRVLIVDDHAVVRAGLRLLLDAQDDIETVGEAGDAREAIFEARSTKPDVVLMDVVLGGKSGIEVTPELLHEQPETRVLVLSMQDDPRYVREAFAAGAHGYVLKEAADAEPGFFIGPEQRCWRKYIQLFNDVSGVTIENDIANAIVKYTEDLIMGGGRPPSGGPGGGT